MFLIYVTLIIIYTVFLAYQTAYDSTIVSTSNICDRNFSVNIENNLKLIALKICLKLRKNAIETFQMSNNESVILFLVLLYYGGTFNFHPTRSHLTMNTQVANKENGQKHCSCHSCFKQTSKYWLQITKRID